MLETGAGLGVIQTKMEREHIIEELKQVRYKVDLLIAELEREQQAHADEQDSVEVAQPWKPGEPGGQR